jgi:hypothetical protein
MPEAAPVIACEVVAWGNSERTKQDAQFNAYGLSGCFRDNAARSCAKHIRENGCGVKELSRIGVNFLHQKPRLARLRC